MRKALRRDVDKRSMIPLTHPIGPEDLEDWSDRVDEDEGICRGVGPYGSLGLSGDGGLCDG